MFSEVFVCSQGEGLCLLTEGWGWASGQRVGGYLVGGGILVKRKCSPDTISGGSIISFMWVVRHPNQTHIYRPHMKYGGRICFYTCLSFCSQGGCRSGSGRGGSLALRGGGLYQKADPPYGNTVNARSVRILLE